MHASQHSRGEISLRKTLSPAINSQQECMADSVTLSSERWGEKRPGLDHRLLCDLQDFNESDSDSNEEESNEENNFFSDRWGGEREEKNGYNMGDNYTSPGGAIAPISDHHIPTRCKPTSLLDVKEAYPELELQQLWSFQTFNALQTVVQPTIVEAPLAMVVSAPTGCGKTAVFEMAIAQLLREGQQSEALTGKNSCRNQRIIYISPLKALCQQILADWKAKFGSMGLKVVEVTGDSNNDTMSGVRRLASANLILTTPEKWDSLTRLGSEHTFLIGSVKLVLIDEVHMLGEEGRGSTLEMIITRMKALRHLPVIKKAKLPAASLRFLAVSATLPNLSDVGNFLGATKQHTFNFGPEFRPVPLQLRVLGFDGGSNPYLFDRSLNGKVSGLVSEYSAGRPCIVFCASKKDTTLLATKAADSRGHPIDKSTAERLQRASSDVDNICLRKCLVKGIAFHNGSLTSSDRSTVELLFKEGQIAILLATTTLSMGVNLPAHLVIIKGTNLYRGAGTGYKELPASAILQMSGRAGRPGFDKKGVAIVMTSVENRSRLEASLKGSAPIESHLNDRLTEALLCEVHHSDSLVQNISEAITWAKLTFLYRRMQSDPMSPHDDGLPKYIVRYGLRTGQTNSQLDEVMKSRILNALHELHDIGAIKILEDGFSLASTEVGSLFARYMVCINSMRSIVSLPLDCSAPSLLAFICGCKELQVTVRRAEKKVLNEMNEFVRWPPPKKFRVKTSAHKAATLLQVAAGSIPMEDQGVEMGHETNDLVREGCRLLACTARYFMVRNAPEACIQAELLSRSIHVRCWENYRAGQLQQLPGVGDVVCRHLVSAGVITLHQAAMVSPAFIDQALCLQVRRLPPSSDNNGCGGVQIVLQLAYPEFALQFSKPTLQNHYRHLPDSQKKQLQARGEEHFLIVFSNEAANVIYVCRRTKSPSTHNVNLFISNSNRKNAKFDKDPMLQCYLLPTGYAGGDVVNVSFRPSQIPKNGELWQPQKICNQVKKEDSISAGKANNIKNASPRQMTIASSKNSGNDNSKSNLCSPPHQLPVSPKMMPQKSRSKSKKRQIDLEMAFTGLGKKKCNDDGYKIGKRTEIIQKGSDNLVSVGGMLKNTERQQTPVLQQKQQQSPSQHIDHLQLSTRTRTIQDIYNQDQDGIIPSAFLLSSTEEAKAEKNSTERTVQIQAYKKKLVSPCTPSATPSQTSSRKMSSSGSSHSCHSSLNPSNFPVISSSGSVNPAVVHAPHLNEMLENNKQQKDLGGLNSKDLNAQVGMSSSHLAQLFGVNNTVGGGYIEGVSCDSHERVVVPNSFPFGGTPSSGDVTSSRVENSDLTSLAAASSVPSGATAVQLMHNHLAAQQEQFSSDSNCNTYFPFLPPPGGPRDQYSMHSLSSAIQRQYRPNAIHRETPQIEQRKTETQQKIVTDTATVETSYSLPSPCTENPNEGYLHKKTPELTFQAQLKLAGIEVKKNKDVGGKGYDVDGGYMKQVAPMYTITSRTPALPNVYPSPKKVFSPLPVDFELPPMGTKERFGVCVTKQQHNEPAASDGGRGGIAAPFLHVEAPFTQPYHHQAGVVNTNTEEEIHEEAMWSNGFRRGNEQQWPSCLRSI